MAAGARGVPGRAGVKQEPVGDRGISRRDVEVLGGSHGERLHHGHARALADRAHARGRFLAMQLQHVGCDAAHDRIEERVVGIDGEGNHRRAAARAGGELCALIERYIARTGREKYQPHEVRARFEGGLQGS
jgi:hypothetical protein